jgi:hypothetical protein
MFIVIFCQQKLQELGGGSWFHPMAQVYKNVVQDICYLKILQSYNNKNRTISAFFRDQIDCYKSLSRFNDNLLQDLQQKCNAIDDNKCIKLPLIHGDFV